LHLTRATEVIDQSCRRMHTKPTVESAATYIASRQAKIGPSLRCTWKVLEADNVPSIEHQMAAHLRRAKKVGQLCGRVINPHSVRRVGALCSVELAR